MMAIVYSPRYDIRFFGLQRLHPFDSCKHSRAWKRLRQRYGKSLESLWIRPDRPVCREQLLRVHSADYLDKLRDSRTVARALELPFLQYLPAWLIDSCVLQPMRWATQGTILAAKAALTRGIAVNLAGGFHHAKPSSGEGFCVYSDIGLAVKTLRDDHLMEEDECVLYIDLDAHQGNGVCHVFLDDPRTLIFDMYNTELYPDDEVARGRIDKAVPLCDGCSGFDYLHLLREYLPPFLDSALHHTKVRLAIYNAGTDVFEEDPLGCMAVSASDILERDRYVLRQLRNLGISTVFLPSGGYSRVSYRMLADSVGAIFEDDRLQQAIDRS